MDTYLCAWMGNLIIGSIDVQMLSYMWKVFNSLYNGYYKHLVLLKSKKRKNESCRYIKITVRVTYCLTVAYKLHIHIINLNTSRNKWVNSLTKLTN